MAGFCGAQSHLDHVVRIELARYSDSEHSRVNSSIIHSIRNFLPLGSDPRRNRRSRPGQGIPAASGRTILGQPEPLPPRLARRHLGPLSSPSRAPLSTIRRGHLPHDHARRRRSPGKRAPRALPPGPVADGRQRPPPTLASQRIRQAAGTRRIRSAKIGGLTSGGRAFRPAPTVGGANAVRRGRTLQAKHEPVGQQQATIPA